MNILNDDVFFMRLALKEAQIAAEPWRSLDASREEQTWPRDIPLRQPKTGGKIRTSARPAQPARRALGEACHMAAPSAEDDDAVWRLR